jgi:hypothetical protein
MQGIKKKKKKMIEIQLPLVTSFVEARLNVGKIRYDLKI